MGPYSTFQYLQYQIPSVSWRSEGNLKERLFTEAWNDRTRWGGFKLKKGRFVLDIGKKLLTVAVVS